MLRDLDFRSGHSLHTVVFPEVPLRSHMEQVPLYLLIFNNMLKIKIIPTTLRSGQWVTFTDLVIGNNLLPISI